MTSNYPYDAPHELTQATQGANTAESYRPSSLGVASYANNNSNELTAASEARYTYDSNGNTTSQTFGSDTTSYTCDYENRLTGCGGTLQVVP